MKLEYFADEKGLNELLETYAETLAMIDDYGKQFIQGILSTPEDYKNCLNQLTGAYIILEPLYNVAVAYKENQELKFYVEKKRELEGKGEKVVATNLEKEAAYSVEYIRRVRNILEAYVSATEKGIITAQTQLKSLTQDTKYKPPQEA